ncbi:hypothetical protein [Bdellovibrio sp. HCB2-146]|uniref:hypothetical protein n=1 Tax=Bdellovibrio sp. HCB2-146 TaxID=3394362 RepID=UPI0039BC321F
MRWKPLRWLKATACIASTVTMCIAPVAHGKAAKSQRDQFNEFVKKTGLSSQVTVGEFWKQVRHAYPPKMRSAMDSWVAIYRNEKMPKLNATFVKGSDGQEQVRLMFSHEGKNMTITLTGDRDKPMKIGNVVYSRKELTKYDDVHPLIKKIITSDASLSKGVAFKMQNQLGKDFILSPKEFAKLLPRQRAEYFVKVRLAVQAAQNVYKTKYGAQALNDLNNKYEYALSILFGDEAEAASNLTGKPCVYAGYLTLYGENGSCGGAVEGEKHYTAAKSASIASCPGNDQPCNPMVYGYKSDGSNFCVPSAQRKNATAICGSDKYSPLKNAQDKKRIVESYLAKRGKSVNLILNSEDKISETQLSEIAPFLTDLKKYINDAVGECDNDPLKSIQKQRKDQQWACDAIRTRAFDLQAFVTNPTPVILPPGDQPVAVNSCDIDKPGSQPTNDPKNPCSCPEGTEEKPGQKEDGTTGPICSPIAVVAAGAGAVIPGAKEGEPKEEDKKCEHFLCIPPIVWWVGAGLLGAFALWKIFDKDKDKDKNKNEYTPPVATDPGTTPTTPTEPVTPINPPACAPPKQIINNVCTLPPIDVLPEPELNSEGGGLEALPGMGSGVR